MRYVLDTNAVSALMKGQPAVVGRLNRVARGEVGIPQPVLAEIRYGLERLPRTKRRASLEEQFELIRGLPARSPWSDAVSEQFGAIKAALERRGERIEDFDAAIAAHALAEGAALVSANVGHMARIAGLRVEDWAA